MENKTKYLLITAAVIAIAAIGGLGWYVYQLKADNDELIETFALEKEEMEDEYTQLAIQYEGYKLKVNNDSLEQKLEDQRLKMQRLVEELKQTKAQDARKISALKKELATVRSVLKHYIAQVDSLNRVNERLVAENTEIKGQMQRVQTQAQQIRQQNETLNKKVTVAAQLKATAVTVSSLNKKGKVEKKNKVKDLVQFQVQFSLAANVTAEVGDKDIYVRILRPNEEVLTNQSSGQFKYENIMLDYSAKRTIEYNGEEQQVIIYYKNVATLDKGDYSVEIFADGNQIGRGSITLK